MFDCVFDCVGVVKEGLEGLGYIIFLGVSADDEKCVWWLTMRTMNDDFCCDCKRGDCERSSRSR